MKFVKSDLTWNAVKKGKRSFMTRRRRPGASSSEIQDSIIYEYEKSGVAILGQHFAEEALDVPIKKRILKLQSPSVSGEVGRSSQPQTPPHEGSAQGSKHASVEPSMENKKDVPNLNDFSGIELLAAAACNSSIYDNSVHVESSEVVHTTPKVSALTDGIKEDIAPMDSDESRVQDSTIPVTQNLCNNGNGEGDKSPVLSKGVRLHWDLNTVPDEWEEHCDILADPHTEKDYIFNDGLLNGKTNLEGYENRNSQVTVNEKGSTLRDVAISAVPFSKPVTFGIHGNDDGAIICKASDAESCMSNPAKCENVSTSAASVSLGQKMIKVEPLTKSDDGQAVSEVVQGGCVSVKGDGDGDDKLTSEDRLSDCCGSNVSHDERVEGDTIDKLKAGYDSPVEDGELREPTRYHPWQKEEVEERECVDYESDNMYEDNFDTIESVQTEIPLDRHQTIGVIGAELINEIQQGNKADALGSKDEYRPQEHSKCAILEEKDGCPARFRTERRSGGNMFCIDRSPSTSFDVRKNSACIRRSRSDIFGDTYSQAERDFCPEKFIGRDRPAYNGRAPNDASGQWGGPFSRSSHGYPATKNVIGGSRGHDNNHAINYNPRGNFRTFNRRPSPADRNESYGGIHRGTSPARGTSRDRSRGGFRRPPQEEYYDSELGYAERKTFSSNFDRGAHPSQSRRRSRSRSRSGSPIAWHFQKKRNLDTKQQSPDLRSDTRFPFRKPGSSGENEASRSFNDRNIINGQYRDRRSSPVRTFQRNQRFDPPGYVGRLKSEDNFRPIPRPGRLPQANGNDITLLDDKNGVTNERRRFRYDVDESFSARYPRNKDNGFRYARNENRCFRDPENTSEEKGCRYVTNKMFNTGERDFRKDNLQRE